MLRFIGNGSSFMVQFIVQLMVQPVSAGWVRGLAEAELSGFCAALTNEDKLREGKEKVVGRYAQRFCNARLAVTCALPLQVRLVSVRRECSFARTQASLQRAANEKYRRI
ncbi:hypothetical protein [Paraburkholderia sp. ZP32-5]|uniref:hypothetical protein n=1 Tax=Paraburkholderia sp. ZP32-5 TaxID=2883245 RepID=UPI001F3BEEC4|nr:hypothetical protein [Paraburkholderia sp. ZP32-5]